MPTASEKRAIKRIFDAAQTAARKQYPHLSISYILYLLDKCKTGNDSQHGCKEEKPHG